MAGDRLHLVRRFMAAFNARDEVAFLSLLDKDVVFRNPLGNVVAQGLDEASEWLAKNDSDGVYVEPDGPEHDDGVRIAVPVRMRMANGTQLLPAGVFEIPGDKIARFEVTMNRASVGA